ncbi:MAG: SUMF1/EgtB/PvdO family nonheme iron enzyme [Deltaproteobacteria bacterium]|nr:SUMF1/EgtB/PvdO family nonheme iron enzyme [Deltaproteobacteria bacterium]
MTKDFKEGDRIAGRYEIRSLVGRGPFGAVYAAQDAEIEVTVALKLFDVGVFPGPGERRRAVDTLRLARKISHRNLNRVFDVGEDGDAVFVAAQFIEGVSLDRAFAMRAEKGDRFSLDEADALLSQLVSALEVVHRTTFHGDLRPANILILPDAIKITDLYLREALDGNRFATSLGPFHAPEVREGRGDTRSDLFSLGAIAFELLVGKWDEACARGGAAERVGAAGKPASVTEFVSRAVAANPADRFVSPAELIEAFRETIAPTPTREGARRPGGAPAKIVVAGPGEHVEADASTARQPSLEFPESGDRAKAAEKPARPPVPPPLPSRSDAPRATKPVEKAAPQSPPLPPGTIPDAKVPERPPHPRGKSSARTPTPPVGEAVWQKPSRDWPAGFVLRWALLAAAFVVGTAGSLVAIDQIDGEIARLRAQPIRDPAADAGKGAGAVADAGAVAVVVAVADAGAGAVADAGARAGAGAGAGAAPDRDVPSKVVPPKKGKCAKGMALVKGGKTPVGSAASDPLRAFGDRAFEWVKVDDFCVDVFEYPGYRGAMPATRVSFGEAQGICERALKRLCSEDEWERACNGGRKIRYPYGDEFDADTCNSADATGAPRNVAPVGEYRGCRSPSGAVDMSGNVAEWTAATSAQGAKLGAVRGGSSLRPDYGVRCASRLRKPAGERSGEIGFRCCATP